MGDSVQVINNPHDSRLHVPKNQGRLHKGHNVAAATTSIPTKYQTIVISNSDKKGFNARSKRFNYEKDGTENPGPGSYVSHSGPEKQSASFSKKGTGGFASKDKRMGQFYNIPHGPGAGVYALPSLLSTASDFNQGGNTSVFHKPIAKAQSQVSKTPAPNSYDVHRSKGTVHKANNVTANAAFKSKSKREFIDLSDTMKKPAPWHYQVDDRAVKPSEPNPVYMFKSTSKRKFAPDPPPIPGPGAYKPYEEVEPVQKTVFPRKHYLCISAPAMPLPKTPQAPGPGAYETVDYDGPPRHYMSGASFVSTTTRWQGPKADNANMPGPAHYRPQEMEKQSFIYNALNRWI